MTTNNDNKETPIMDELKSGDIVVYEEQECLVVEVTEEKAILEYDGEQFDVPLEEMTKAAETINIKNPHGNLSQMTASVINMMGSKSGDDQVQFFNKVQALFDKGKDHGTPAGAAGKNKSSVENHGNKDTQTTAQMAVKVKSMSKEDLDEILGDEEGLSEDFKDKVAALFEAAIALRVSAVAAELQEAHDAEIERLNEEKEAQFAELTETLEEQIDQYLSYAASEWLSENEVAVEASIRTSLSESFISGLHQLCAEHNMELPEADVPAVEALAERVEELETDLNEAMAANMELVEAIDEYSAQQVFEEVSDGLATTQVEKFATLVEGIDFDGDADAYKTKLEVVKEKHFTKSAVPASALNEEVEIDEDDKEEFEHADANVQNYAKALSRTLKR